MDKYTVITGASSGIGYAAAKAFARRGKNLILIARRLEQLEQLKSDIGKTSDVKVVIITADLSITENVYDVYSKLNQYFVETWINNAGFGNYSSVAEQDLKKVEDMIKVNITVLTIFSSLYVRDYNNSPGTQLINISSAGGYTIVPNAVTYCAAKFYVSAFTEGLARELSAENSPLKAKILAPAATKTEFGKVASNAENYDYNAHFKTYHTAEEMAEFLLQLYDSDCILGKIDRSTFDFELSDGRLPYAGK